MKRDGFDSLTFEADHREKTNIQSSQTGRSAVFRCVRASLYEGPSVRLSVLQSIHPSFRPSVRCFFFANQGKSDNGQPHFWRILEFPRGIG